MKFVSRDRIFLSCDKSVDLTEILLCRATLFKCLRRNHLSLRQIPMMLRHKPDLLLFRTIAGTGDLLLVLSYHLIAEGYNFCREHHN